jgi:cytochrome c6
MQALRRKILSITVLMLAAGGAQGSDIFKGKEVYDLHCQSCHGANGQSMEIGVPDFSRGESMFKPDYELVNRLRSGGDLCPTFEGLLREKEMRDVIAYIRTLQQ